MSHRAKARVVLVALAVGLAGCGGGHAGASLAWRGTPQVFRYRDLPRDRVLGGQIENRSGQPLELDARRITLRDGRGQPVRGATVRFLASYAHGLYSPTQFGEVQNALELKRLGIRLQIAPRQVLPFNAAWRLPPGAPPAVSVDYGGGSLPIPSGSR